MKNKKKSGSENPDKKVKEGVIPGTLQNQNLGHNSKKESLGRNTNR
ncbi:MAG: hypothetical protein PHV71_05955 [Eubacteriales bacterium]|nr:hypothetical protein [Eubacteriales bacterium]MDD3199852.1 hypothetical protein [Eubacteriales bacterium]MDD4630116.1 hypothetical protein [Eubacteriales bacterium]